MKIYLRDIKLNDIDFLFNLYNSRDPKDILTPIKYEEQENFIKKFLADDISHPYINWKIIELKDVPIGSITLSKCNNELGYWLIKEFQGKGIGPESVTKFMNLCKKGYYTALVRPENYASTSLIRKLGFDLTHHRYTIKIS